MKEIKRRLLSLAMTGLLLLGTTLSDAHAGESKSLKNVDEATKNAAAEKLMKIAGKQSDSKKSKSADSETQKETGKSKSDKAESDKSDKTKDESDKSGKSEKSEKSGDESDESGKTGKAEKSEKTTNQSEKDAEEVRLTLSISRPSGLSATEGVYQIDPDKVSAITLSWKCKGDCDGFEVSVSGGTYSASTGKKSARIPVADLPAGKYTATVKAIRDGKTVAKEKLGFRILASKVENAPQGGEEEAVAQNAVEEAAEAHEPSAQEQQASTEEQPAVEQATSEADQPVEVQEDSTEVQPTEEQDNSTEIQAVEEQERPAEDQPVAEQEISTEDQSAEEQIDFTENLASEAQIPGNGQEAVEEPPVGDAQETTVEEPVKDVQEAEEAQTVEEAQEATEEQPAGDAREATVDPLAEDTLEAVEVLPAGDARNVADEQPDEAVQEILLDEIVLAETEEQAKAAKPAQKRETVVDVQVDEDEATVEAAPEALEDPIILDEALGELTSDADPSTDAEIENARGDASAPTDEEKGDAAITLSVKGAQGISVIGSAIHVDPSQADTVALVWQYGGKCDGYAVSVSGGVYDTTTSKTRLSLPVAGLAPGQYTVSVAAMKDGQQTASAQLSFQIDDAGNEEGAESGLSLTVASPQGLLITEGVYQVDPTQADALTLAWSFGGECDGYDVGVSGDVYSGRVEESRLTLPLSGMEAGTYTVSVAAVKDESPVADAQLAFSIAGEEKKQDEQQGEDQKQGQQPQGGGARAGGSGGGSARSGGADEAEQGFHITPGEALVSTHNSGSRDMSLYGAIDLTLDAEATMTQLVLGGVALDVRLSGGEPFTASIEADALSLVPVGESQAWLLNGYALKTLARSGISTLRLVLGDATIEFPTQPKLAGSHYGMLCAEGVASKDYCYAVDANGCSVTVAERTYRLTSEGELV